MRWKLVVTLLMAGIIASSPAPADELTKIVQQDLTTLGYDTGGIDGKAGTKTIVAISKFQADQGIEVTGEATPQLAGIIKAAIKKQGPPAQPAARVAATAPAPVVAPARSQAELQAAQQACLQQKMDAAQASSKKKRGFGKLFSAISRTASRFGGSKISQTIAQTSNDVYSATATADDLKGAAKDLGLTEDDMQECRNPK